MEPQERAEAEGGVMKDFGFWMFMTVTITLVVVGFGGEPDLIDALATYLSGNCPP